MATQPNHKQNTYRERSCFKDTNLKTPKKNVRKCWLDVRLLLMDPHPSGMIFPSKSTSLRDANGGIQKKEVSGRSPKQTTPPWQWQGCASQSSEHYNCVGIEYRPRVRCLDSRSSSNDHRTRAQDFFSVSVCPSTKQMEKNTLCICFYPTGK